VRRCLDTKIATRAEQAAVRPARIKWRDYDRFMQQYVKQMGDERLTEVPADLDTKPYRDEHDYDLLNPWGREKFRVPYSRSSPRHCRIGAASDS
jgi:hypothetical protein